MNGDRNNNIIHDEQGDKKHPMVLSSFTAAEYGDVHSLLRRIQRETTDANTTSITMTRRCDAAGNTPLHLAAQHGHVPATVALLAAGCNPNGYIEDEDDENDENDNTTWRNGNNVGDEASQSNNMTQQVQLPPPPPQQKRRRRCIATPLHRASFSGAVGTMHLLIEHNRCTTSPSRSGSRVVIGAIGNRSGGSGGGGGGGDDEKSRQECQLLVQDWSFGDGKTPLHKAISGGRPLAVQLLIDTHRDRESLEQALSMVDGQGLTPLELAQQQVQLIQSSSLSAHEERARVARWNAIAGGEPDWSTCLELVQIAQASIELHCPPCSLSSSDSWKSRRLLGPTTLDRNSKATTTMTATTAQPPQQPSPQAPPPPQVVLPMYCLNDNCDDRSGISSTVSWERSLWNALSQNIHAVLDRNNKSNTTPPSWNDVADQQAPPPPPLPPPPLSIQQQGGGDVSSNKQGEPTTTTQTVPTGEQEQSTPLTVLPLQALMEQQESLSNLDMTTRTRTTTCGDTSCYNNAKDDDDWKEEERSNCCSRRTAAQPSGTNDCNDRKPSMNVTLETKTTTYSSSTTMTLGTVCTSCGKHTIALYPVSSHLDGIVGPHKENGAGGGILLVCKDCKRAHRRRRHCHRSSSS